MRVADVYFNTVDVGNGAARLDLLVGEAVAREAPTLDGGIVLTNYQLLVWFVEPRRPPCAVPIAAIDCIEVRNFVSLHLHTKLVHAVAVTFADSGLCDEWCKFITDETLKISRPLAPLFSVTFHAATSDLRLNGDIENSIENIARTRRSSECLVQEIKRLSFTKDERWRVTDVNKEFKLCASYPRQLVVPATVTDEELENVAKFRCAQRIPTAVWRHPGNRCIIARSSQPVVGWFGWRCPFDEALVDALVTRSVDSQRVWCDELIAFLFQL